MTTETRQKKPLPEQTAQHVYNAVPARSSATVTEEPSPSRQRRQPEANSQPGPTQRMPASRQAPPLHSQPRTNAPQEEEYDDAHVYPQRPPSSARRYKPTEPSVNTRTVPNRGQARAFYTLIVACSIFIGIALATFLPPLWQRGSDQLHYGFPRTYQVDANVGHGTRQYPDTHFIALNNHGYVEVLEIPEGIPDRDHPPQLYLVTRIDGADADHDPAMLTFEDVNGDGKVDIIVHCNGNESILYNSGHTFKPTP